MSVWSLAAPQVAKNAVLTCNHTDGSRVNLEKPQNLQDACKIESTCAYFALSDSDDLQSLDIFIE